MIKYFNHKIRAIASYIRRRFVIESFNNNNIPFGIGIFKLFMMNNAVMKI